MTVRSKMRLTSVRFFNEEHTGTREYLFSAMYDMSIPEDRRFQKATPFAEFKQLVDNPAVFDKFVVGQDYYVDVTPAT